MTETAREIERRYLVLFQGTKEMAFSAENEEDALDQARDYVNTGYDMEGFEVDYSSVQCIE